MNICGGGGGGGYAFFQACQDFFFFFLGGGRLIFFCLCFKTFFLMHIGLRTPVPFFQPGSVHSDTVS